MRKSVNVAVRHGLALCAVALVAGAALAQEFDFEKWKQDYFDRLQGPNSIPLRHEYNPLISFNGLSFQIMSEKNKTVQIVDDKKVVQMETWGNPGVIEVPEFIEFYGEKYEVAYVAPYCFYITDEVSLPKSVKFIGCGNFGRATKVELSEGLLRIEDGGFQGGQYKYIKLPSTLMTIGKSCFNNTKLEEIDFSDGLVYIGSGSFCNNEKLKSAILPNSIMDLIQDCFNGNTYLLDVKLPRHSHAVETSFNDCPFIRSIECPYTIHIPSIIDSFRDIDFGKCRLIVPDGKREMYAKHEFFGKFANIVEKSQSAVDDVVIEASEQPTAIYDLNGIRRDGSDLKSGEIYVKQQGKKSEKVLIP